MNMALWTELHRQQDKHRLRYPSEHVVRWLAGLPNGEATLTALDIGCGWGRHVDLLADFGYSVEGIDLSSEVASPTCVLPKRQGDMRELPYDNETFDIALAYGVFYYGTLEDHIKAVGELHRVLVPGGKALVVTRTHRDSRSTLAEYPGDEAGMTMNFLNDADVRSIYSVFGEIGVELSETTRDSRLWRDSDWLIRVTK